jgi:predicted permease
MRFALDRGLTIMKLFRRLLYLLRQRQIEADIAEELEAHRQMARDRALQDGAAPSEAAAASRRVMGNVTLAREDARAEWIAPWLESVWQDLRYGVRHLVAHPAFTITTAATLLLATVLNTSFFTWFNATVLRAWPVPDAGRVVLAHSRSAEAGGADGILLSDFEFMRKQARSFSALSAMRTGGSRVWTTPPTTDDFTFYVPSGYVSASFFTGLRVPMAIGRGFTPDEDLPERPGAVAIISAGLWQRAFGGDPSVLGRTIYVNAGRHPVTIVGVTASSVNGAWPFERELWMPMAASARYRTGSDCCVAVAGRLADGVSRETALAELAVLTAQLDAASQRKARIVSLSGTRPFEQPGGAVRVAPLALVLGGLLAILLLACSNVGNLQLARAFARRRELATRLAIGANRRRIVRQLLTETLLVSAVVSAAALVLSYVLPEAILRATGALEGVRVLPDVSVAVFTLALCVIATIVSGLVPALRGTRDAADFAAVNRGPLETRPALLRTVLLGTQITLSATLLFGATLLTRGLVHAWNVDPGYSLDAVSVVKVTLPPQAYDPARSTVFRTQLRDAFAGANLGPVGMADEVPLQPSALGVSVRRPADAVADARRVHLRSYSAELFTLLNIPVVAGRLFDERQTGEVMINESMARAFWRDSSAVGQLLIDRARTLEVVGVVRDAQMIDLGPVEPAMFMPRMLGPLPAFLIRGDVPQAQIRGIVGQLDSRAIVTIAPLADTLRQALNTSYTGVTISWMLGALALVLAVGGVFGVFSYLVEERTREIGIRVALGARRPQVVAALFGTTRTALIAGLFIAAVLSFAAGRVLRAFLYGLSPVDPLAYLGTATILALAAVAATIVPIRRAMTVDPVVALRHE